MSQPETFSWILTTSPPCLLQEGLLPMSALCLSHSHSAADMEGLIPASTTSSSTSSTCTTTSSSCNSSTTNTTTASSSNSSNSSSTLSAGRGECPHYISLPVCTALFTLMSCVTSRPQAGHRSGRHMVSRTAARVQRTINVLELWPVSSWKEQNKQNKNLVWCQNSFQCSSEVQIIFTWQTSRERSPAGVSHQHFSKVMF